MKINVGLLGLAAAQSGDDRFEDNSYDYDTSSDRWSNENQFNLDEANAGITFGVMARVTKQQNADHFQKAVKLSCWNSNMIRDMNNDNKFSVYFNDQVEFKRFQPGLSTGTNPGTANGGTVETENGRDDLSWLYAVGDLRTGNNHQYGFENSDSDPYDISTDTDRQGGVYANNDVDYRRRNNNRLRQVNEIDYAQPLDASATTVTNSVTSKTTVGRGIHVDDANHSQRPPNKWTQRKWGYQSDNVERAASYGYDANTVVYHFGHHDNRDNTANRPNMRYGASLPGEAALETAYAASATALTAAPLNMHKHEFDFHGFKDDWRYSLRMGGCLYEAARWVYDESSFHRTSRLTYTDDTLFMDDPFNPMDANKSDIFGAHNNGNTQTTNSGSAGTSIGELGGTNFTTLFDNPGSGTETTAWTNAGSTYVASGEYVHGDCNTVSCTDQNVATPSSGGVFADVHWVHVFNAHIFPLQDVGYYQYDQTMGLGNINVENDSITSRDGYGYNIYGSANNKHVMRDVWGVAGDTSLIDAGSNNAPLGQNVAYTADGDNFHSQYGTLNIGNVGTGGHGDTYLTATTDMRPNGLTDADDFVPILTKTRRKIEDFNVVMANPTYEGHGFLNFVATYHDHTENYPDNDTWIRQVGKRFLSTIGGLTTASNHQRNVCRALKDGIDSYRMNGIMPGVIGDGSGTGGGPFGWGHDDPVAAPLGPGAAGDYGNGQRCGAAMYENFGDWFLRPAQTYAAYNTFSEIDPTGATVPAGGDGGWNNANAACSESSATDFCITGMESYNYWAFILSEDYSPINAGDGAETPLTATGTASVGYSQHELWRNGSMHYDFPGAAGDAVAGTSGSSGRGFAISSFPHNELGKDFRFNIRTLHNMGDGVAKQYYQIAALRSGQGNEASIPANTATSLLTSNLRTTETVWSYYFYAVDTIKIAFPEFVARVNHCDKHAQRNSSHCTTINQQPTSNGNPSATFDANRNAPSAYPGYTDGHPYSMLGFQNIIIDGVTMKKTDNQYDSRTTGRDSEGADSTWHHQYNFARGLREDDHSRASLHYWDITFANEDASMNVPTGATDVQKMCHTDMSKLNMNTPEMLFYGGDNDATKQVTDAGGLGHYQGYTDSYQPLKPCASWCALDEFAVDALTGQGVDPSLQSQTGAPAAAFEYSTAVAANTSISRYGGICGRVLRIDGLLQTYDELHNRQYGTIQEIWIQLQYAYQESLDNSARVLDNTLVERVQSPFPNVFFSAPEVIDIRGFCPSSNMKCRGYMSDQHQPYGGAREHASRVHWNAAGTRPSNMDNAFGANRATTNQQTGNDWTQNKDFRSDSKWPWNYHSYNANAGTGTAYGGTGYSGTTYNSRDYNHDIYTEQGTGAGQVVAGK